MRLNPGFVATLLLALAACDPAVVNEDGGAGGGGDLGGGSGGAGGGATGGSGGGATGGSGGGATGGSGGGATGGSGGGATGGSGGGAVGGGSGGGATGGSGGGAVGGGSGGGATGGGVGDDGGVDAGPPNVCGDGLRAGAEVCDDGNVVSGDGCDASCAIEVGFTCTGAPSVCLTTCGDGLRAGAEACDDGNMSSGDGCGACDGAEPGFSCTGNAPTVCVTSCGDGARAGTEACDDGDFDSGDGCSASCAIENGYTCSGALSVCVTTCGDGLLAGSEACDDGNQSGSDGCSASCAVEPGFACTGAPSTCVTTCGDGARAGTEACDDGNLVGNDGCSASCVTDPGYTCAGSPSTCVTTCGDGVPAGTELCDDGNQGNFDGCASCVVQSGFACTGSPSMCMTTCGDGVRAGAEQCDDNNTNAGDGCNASCQFEFSPEAEPNNGCSLTNGPFTIPTAGLGRLVSGVIAPTDEDWFSFTIPTWSDLSFETFNSGSLSTCGIDTVLELYTSDCGTRLAIDDENGLNSCSRLAHPTEPALAHLPPGTYRLGVSPFGSTGFAYSVQARVLASCGNGLREGSEDCDGEPFCGSDCMRIPVCGDAMRQPGEQCDDGNLTPADGCSSTCQWETTAEVEPNGTTAEADANGSITGTTNFTGLISPNTDLDFYKLTIATQTAVRFEIFDATGRSCNLATGMVLLLRDAGGGLLKSDTPGGDTTMSGIGPCPALVANLAPGTYYVQTRGSSITTAPYFLQVKFASPATELEPNDTRLSATPVGGICIAAYGDHQVAGDVDVYAVTLLTTSALRAEVIEGDAVETCESGGINSTLTLFDSAGTSLATDTDDGRGLCSGIDGTGGTPRDPGASSLLPGTYFLEVKSNAATALPAHVFNYKLVVDVRR